MSETLAPNPLERPENLENVEAAQRLEAQVEEVYSGINFDNPDTAVILDKPLSEDQKVLNERAIERLVATRDAEDIDVPKPLQIERDWADTLQTHKQKQDEHIQKAIDILAERGGSAQEHAERRQEINDHNERLSVRQAAKEDFLIKQKFQHGEKHMELFSNEMDAAAEEHVVDVLGSDYAESVADTDALKEESKLRKEKAQAQRQKTSDAAKEFYKGTSSNLENEPAPRKKKSRSGSAGTVAQKQPGTDVALYEGDKDGKESNIFAGNVHVKYQPNKVGWVRTAYEFTQKDSVIPMGQVGSSGLIITTKFGERYYANEGSYGDVYDLAQSEAEGEPVIIQKEAGKDAYSDIVVGKPWKNGSFESDEVVKVEMADNFAGGANTNSGYEERAQADPFEDADSIINGLNKDGKTHTIKTPRSQMVQEGQKLVVREKGPKGFVRRAFNKARFELTTLAMNPKEYFTDKEKGKRRILGAAVAAVAVAATVKYGLLSGDEHNHAAGTSVPTEGTPNHSNPFSGNEDNLFPSRGADTSGSESLTPSHPSQVGAEQVAPSAGEVAPRTVTLAEGDNIWNKSSEYLQANGFLTGDKAHDDMVIDTVKDAVLKSQGLSETDATQLSAGYTFNMPPREAIEELLKTS